MPTRQGSIRLFRLFGITVYLHWAWFLVAVFFVEQARGYYSSMFWSVLECLSLFGIVLIHEFGHQLACRSVGGQTHDIVLWPLGGVAYVTPPQRPGATLWSIAAGPLVNVILFPLLLMARWVTTSIGLDHINPDAYNFVFMLFYINATLLVFNMLPIYPLDGGQILRSLLWFIFGRANSLLAATIIGMIGAVLLLMLAVLSFLFLPPEYRDQSIWLAVVCAFILMNAWAGFRQARALAKFSNAPRRAGFICPGCKMSPPIGNFWRCSKCGQSFDAFGTRGFCPHCATQYNATSCPECGSLRPFSEWESFGQFPPRA